MELPDVPGPLQRTTVDHTGLDDAAGAVADLIKSLLPGGAEVSVVVRRGTEMRTVAASGDLARALDGWQYRTDQGPCLQAVASAVPVYAADLRTETRWPSWVRHSVDAGARSALSLGLSIDNAVTGAINLYSTRTDAFPDDTTGLPQGLAACAAAALTIIDRYDAQAAQVRHLQAAMVHRAVIEQAKGIIMGERRCTADEAFAVLVNVSQTSNRKVRDVAAALVRRAATTPSGPSSPAAVPPTQFTTDVDGSGVAVIRVVGDLVIDTAGDLLVAITAALRAEPLTRVVVDLARVPSLDRAAVGALLQGRAAALQAGASLRVVRPQPPVRQVLHLTDTCQLLTAMPPAVERAAVRSVR